MIRINHSHVDEMLEISFERYLNKDIKMIGIYDNKEKIEITSVAHEKIGPKEVVIKNHSNNEGILWDLIEYQIVSEPKRFFKRNTNSLAVCELLIEIPSKD